MWGKIFDYVIQQAFKIKLVRFITHSHLCGNSFSEDCRISLLFILLGLIKSNNSSVRKISEFYLQAQLR